MKKLLYPLFCFAILLCVFSCKQKTKEEQIQEFQLSLTQEDTTAMLQLCDDCMELLHKGKIDEAIGSLYEYDDSLKEVYPLSETTIKRYKHIYTMFPVIEYTRAYYSFQLEGLNDVKYEVKFSETDGGAMTAFMFNPVKLKDKWYLTVKSADQEIDEKHR